MNLICVFPSQWLPPYRISSYWVWVDNNIIDSYGLPGSFLSGKLVPILFKEVSGMFLISISFYYHKTYRVPTKSVFCILINDSGINNRRIMLAINIFIHLKMLLSLLISSSALKYYLIYMSFIFFIDLYLGVLLCIGTDYTYTLIKQFRDWLNELLTDTQRTLNIEAWNLDYYILPSTQIQNPRGLLYRRYEEA